MIQTPRPRLAQLARFFGEHTKRSEAAGKTAAASLRGRRMRRRATATGLTLALAASLLTLPTSLNPGGAAHAATEVPQAGLTFKGMSATFDRATINNSATNRTQNLGTQAVNLLYYGITQDKNENARASSTSPFVGRYQYVTAEDTGEWTYVARGKPWAWDRVLGINRIPALRADGQNTTGYQPVNPGTVQPGTTFLIGRIRHNNYQVETGYRYLHSTLKLNIGDGLATLDLPFTNYDTPNNDYTTLVPRAGGAYVSLPLASCRSLGGASYTARRGLVDGKFTGYYRNGNSWGCAQHVGAGNGDYDLYNRPHIGPNKWERADVVRYFNGGGRALNRTPITGTLVVGEYDWPDAIDISTRTPASDDLITFDGAEQSFTFTQDGKNYRMTLRGLTQADGENCAATLPAGAQTSNVFRSKEDTDTFACLYATYTEERQIRFAKTALDPTDAKPAIPDATLTVSAGGTYTPLAAGATVLTNSVGATSFLTPDTTTTLYPSGFGDGGRDLDPLYTAIQIGNSDLTIDEAAQAETGASRGGQWQLRDVQCVNGVGDTVTVTRTQRGINLKDVGPAPSGAASPITCTFINSYERGHIRVSKSLVANEATSGAKTFNVDYRVDITNDGGLRTWSGRVADAPNFAPGLRINNVRVTAGPNGYAALNTQRNTVSPINGAYLLTNSIGLAAGQSWTYWVRINVTLDEDVAGFNEERLACSVVGGIPQPGSGLYNTLQTTVDKDHDGADNNTACAPVPSPHSVMILKGGTQDTGIAEGRDRHAWSYTYASGAEVTPIYPLPGSAFAIYDKNPNTDASATIVRTLDDASGNQYAWKIEGLELERSYWLVETRAPVAHALLPRPVEFRVSALRANGTGTRLSLGAELNDPRIWVAGQVQAYSSDSNTARAGTAYKGRATLIVKDTDVGVLPKSGGLGPWPYVGAGVLLLGAAGGLILYARRGGLWS